MQQNSTAYRTIANVMDGDDEYDIPDQAYFLPEKSCKTNFFASSIGIMRTLLVAPGVSDFSSATDTLLYPSSVAI
jgi:hypothetical protein